VKIADPTSSTPLNTARTHHPASGEQGQVDQEEHQPACGRRRHDDVAQGRLRALLRTSLSLAGHALMTNGGVITQV